MIYIIHEPSCERGSRPCTCSMYALDEENLQCLGLFVLSDLELLDLLENDSIGGC